MTPFAGYSHIDVFHPRIKFLVLIAAAALLILRGSPAQASESPIRPVKDTDPNSLIAAVNDLRASHGLPAYAVNSILMDVTQSHAAYMASTGSVTHYSADGSRPFQRALAAGYPVAGDLSLGGFYSENIIGGSGMSVQEAVQAWTGDTPHLNTMLSPNLTEIGAGAVNAGGYMYYVIDAARRSGTMPTYNAPAYDGTQPAGGGAEATPVPVNTLVPNTPLSNGAIVHIVKAGETLWLIAISYGVKVDDLLSLNQLLPTSAIFPGQKLIVRLAATAAPATITPTRTRFPSPTAIATFTPIPTLAPSQTPVRQSALTGTASLTAVLGIVLVALIAAAAFAVFGQSRRS